MNTGVMNTINEIDINRDSTVFLTKTRLHTPIINIIKTNISTNKILQKSI